MATNNLKCNKKTVKEIITLIKILLMIYDDNKFVTLSLIQINKFLGNRI